MPIFRNIVDALAGKRLTRREAKLQSANRQTWTYVHPPHVLNYEREADTRDLHAFALAASRVDPTAISRRTLISLYAEFCEVHEVRPMPWGKFDRSLKGAGFKRYRSSLPGRPWLYEAVKRGDATVLKLAPPTTTTRAAA